MGVPQCQVRSEGLVVKVLRVLQNAHAFTRAHTHHPLIAIKIMQVWVKLHDELKTTSIIYTIYS